ncbi:hypothetical protein [Hoeflea prorocentri]|uniref:Carbohydrate-binding family V/XII n=1 Tax=Hoeflea prorocentri TaxID=1922333 RepID=A0A9X3UMD0_9HYPH|nr:hypothetical protein [Hoeflea prorocentri]MCY6383244.1 hypothetical protein [Hoeflea prorocentri]MDA5401044.1 hypothetical protein [Hoeflea prorocentri]
MVRLTASSLLRLGLAALLAVSGTGPGFAQAQTGAAQQNPAGAQASEPWPRNYETPAGAIMTLHQPQVTEWKNYTSMTALIASEYKAKGSQEPAYGVIEVTAKTAADRENDEVTLSDLTVANINFSTLTRNQLSDASLEIGKLLPPETLTLSLTRLTASLANYERLQDAPGFTADAPTIFVSEKPAVLLQTNGKPTTAPVKGVSGLEFVINTNWDLLAVGDPATYYLRVDKSWLTSKKIDGTWEPVSELPSDFAKLPDDENWKEAREAMPPAPLADDAVPVVYYSDKPAELVVIDGEPALQPIAGTDLEWVSNANTDLFRDTANNTWYFLTSGRWFSASDLKGPWSFASENLPDDFRNIPDGEPYSIVRASVPGTSESQEARLTASIPTTARVSRSDVSVDVTYFGDPKFERITGTDMAYAVNTNFTVILVGGKYFVLYNGVWFIGDAPTGPFTVADTVPDEMYTIPPSSPVYNVTYVRVYETTPDYVVYGYTSGYLWAFLAWGTLIYGTGYYYPPYWVYTPGYPPIYRPWRVTYGSGTYYLPGRGTFTAHYGRAYGPYGGIAAGGIYNQNTGGYIRGARAWGPYNQAGYIAVRGPGGNRYWVADVNGNIYKSWDRGVTTNSRWSRENTASKAQGQWQKRKSGQTSSARGQNILADRDGNVFRKENGNWKQHNKGSWENIKSAAERDKSAKTRPERVKELRQSLDRQQISRQRSTQRFESRRESFSGGRSGLQRPSTRRFERRR